MHVCLLSAGSSIDWAAGIRSTWAFGEEGAQAALQQFLDQGIQHFETRSNAKTLQSQRWGQSQAQAVLRRCLLASRTPAVCPCAGMRSHTSAGCACASVPGPGVHGTCTPAGHLNHCLRIPVGTTRTAAAAPLRHQWSASGPTGSTPPASAPTWRGASSAPGAPRHPAGLAPGQHTCIG
jgi:hypothetical protein